MSLPTLTITANNISVLYSGNTYSYLFSCSFSGTVAGTSTNFSGTLTYSGTGLTGIDAGTYTIIPSGLTSPNYNIVYVNGTLTINKQTLNVYARDKYYVYDGITHTSTQYGFTCSYYGFVNGENESVLSGLTFTGTYTTATAVGSYTITPATISSTNYTMSYNAGTLSIVASNKPVLLITANDCQKVYDGLVYPPANYSYTITGFLNGDTVANLTGTITPPSSSVTSGQYSYKYSGYTSTYYTIVYIRGIVNFTPQSVTFTATNVTYLNDGIPHTKTQYALNCTITPFISGLNTSLIIYGGTWSYASTPGIYSIIPYYAGGNSAFYNNFSITYVTGSLVMYATTLTITADNKSKIYDGTIYSGGYTVTYSGFIDGDTPSVLTGTLTFSGNGITAINNNVSNYTITPSGLTSTKYKIVYVSGTLGIIKRSLTVSTVPVSINYRGVTYADGFTLSLTNLAPTDSIASFITTGLAFSGTWTTAITPGTYTVRPSGLTASPLNYLFTYQNGSLTINKAPLTITSSNISYLYDGIAHTSAYYGFNVNYSGFVNGQTQTSLTGTLSYTGTYSTATEVGNYTIVPTGYTSTNYTISYVGSTLTIYNITNLTVTADNKSTNYLGTIYPSNNYTVTYSGFTNGDTASSLTGTLTFSGTATTNTNVGSYTITPSGLSNPKYNIIYVNGTLTINQAPLTISADNVTWVYTRSVPPFTISYTGFVNNETSSVLGGSLVISGSAYTAVNVGSYTINVSGYTSSNYNITYVSGTSTITPAPLTVTASDKTRNYTGLVTSSFSSPTYSGFVGGDTLTALTGTLTYNTEAINAINAGTYPIILSGYSASNYTITYVNGILTINKKALTVTFSPVSVTYKGRILSSSDFSISPTYSGFVNNETSDVVSGSYSGTWTTAVDVGSYTIDGSTLTSTNYSITSVNSTLTITAIPLTIISNDISYHYDGYIHNSSYYGFTVNYSGFINNETQTSLSGTLSYDGTYITASSVGSYTIIPTGYTSTNYNITYVGSTLTIYEKPVLTITADNKSTNYLGILYPSNNFSVTYSGFIDGDTISSLTGSLTYSGTATTNYTVGSYSIIPSGYLSSKYNIVYVNGTLTINRAPLTITADNKYKVYTRTLYDSSNFTVSYSGFVNDETSTVLGGILLFSGTATTEYNAGSYTIIPSGYTTGNYTITYVNGTLNITPAPLTIIANSITKIYNKHIADLTVTTTGLMLGDTLGTISFSGSAVTAVNANETPYTIIPSGITNSNYTITYVNGTLTINKAPLTITADDITINYRGTLYTDFTSVTTGLLTGDTITPITFTGTATTNINASDTPYIITPTGGTNSNYDVTYINGSLTINKINLTVTADNKSMSYNGNHYMVGYTETYSGFINNETKSVLSGTLLFGGSCLTGTNAGSYVITPYGYSSTNYNISYINGTLTINKVDLSITADNKSMIYNNNIFNNYSVTSIGFVNNEGIESLTGTLTYSGTSQTAINVGTYYIVPSGYFSDNYNITYYNGILTINKAPLTVTADNKSMTYSGKRFNIDYSYSATITGTVIGDIINSSSLQYGGSSQTATSPLNSPYTITVYGLTNSNYDITYVDGSLTINKAPLYVTANNVTIAYTGLVYPLTFTVNYSGFVNNESVSSLNGTLLFNDGITSNNALTAIYPSETPYSIIPSGYTSNNYNIIYQTGYLTINKTNLTITADNKVITYNGNSYSNFTVTYTGFVNNENYSNLTGSLVISGSAVNAINYSSTSYIIIPSGYTSNNYNINYVNGTLTINKAPLNIIADNKSMTYSGTSYPNTFSVTYSGFVNNETSNILTGTLSYIVNYNNIYNVGTYNIIPSGLTSNNYDITFHNGILTISKKDLSITANNITMTYNGQLYSGSNSVTYSGFVNGETNTVLTGTIVYGGTFSNINSKNAGSYTIIPSGLSSNNYNITYYNGTLTINRATLTVSIEYVELMYPGYNNLINNGIMIVDTYYPNFNGYQFVPLFSGFVNGENETALNAIQYYNGKPYYFYINTLTAGINNITATGYHSNIDPITGQHYYGNYNINYPVCTFKILKAPLSITQNNVSMTYNGSSYTGSYSVTYSGFLGTDTETNSVVVGSPNILGNGLTAVNAGTYTITPYNYSALFYNITYYNGTLIINPANLSIIADDQSLAYGHYGYINSFTVSYIGFVNNEDETYLDGYLEYDNSVLSPTDDVGTYPIIPFGYTSNNYNIQYYNGTLYVQKAILNIFIPSIFTPYTGQIYSGQFNIVYDGFMDGDDESKLDGTLVIGGNWTNNYNVGSYYIEGSGLSSTNYEINYLIGSLNIQKTDLFVTANNITMTYTGQICPLNNYTVSYSGFVNGDNSTSLTGTLQFSGTAITAINSSDTSYTIIPSGLSSNNYNIIYQNGSLTINKAPLSITADNINMNYSGSIYSSSYSVTYSGFVNSQTQSVLTGILTYNGTAKTAINTGSYTIIPSGLSSNNYQITYTNGTLTINKVNLTIKADDKTTNYTGIVYPYANYTNTISGFVNNETIAVLTGSLSYTGTSINAVNASATPYTIIPSGMSSNNYNIIYQNGSLTINKTSLSIIANDKTVLYTGLKYIDSNDFTVTYSGFVNSESQSVLTGNLTFNSESTNAINVGTYSITPSGFTSDNYNITYQSGNLHINPINLTIIANNITMTYTGLVYANNYSVTYSGFINNDTQSVLTGSLVISGECLTAINVRDTSYTIILSGLSSTNYIITYQNGSLTINKAPLSITADNKSMTYNKSIYSGTKSVTYSGFVNNETESILNGTLVYSGSYTSGINVGTYTIIPSGLTSNNYDITYYNGSLSINKASLNIKADDKTITYIGTIYSNYSVTISGFVSTETIADLTGTISYSGTSINAINASITSYTIIPSGYSSSNYDITYQNGALTINKAPLSITADNKSISYNKTLYPSSSCTVTYSGFVNNETQSVLTGTLLYSGTFGSSYNAGSYTIIPSGLTSDNYDITYNNGTLTINKVNLTVKADDKLMIYNGNSLSSTDCTVTCTGFVNNETVSVLDGSLVFSGTFISGVDVLGSPYTIIPSGYTSNNYNINFIIGYLNITKAILSITADNKSMTYSGASYLNSFSVTYSGFINNENETVLNGNISYNVDYNGIYSVGTYNIIPSGLTSNNYDISFYNGILYINKTPLMIIADNAFMKYTGDIYNSNYTLTYSGFVNNETESVLSGMIIFSGSSLTAVDVGTYEIIPSGLTSNNYDISYQSGSLIIDPPDIIIKPILVITADNKSMTYSNDYYPNNFTVNYSGFIDNDTESILTGTLTFSGDCLNNKNVGSYTIIASGLTSTKYDIVYVDGTLTINKAPLNITANNLNINYIGTVYSSYTVTYSGFVGNENESILNGSLSFGGNSISNKDVGSYTIIPSGLTSDNYDILYTNGIITINKTDLTVTANNITKSYDGLFYSDFYSVTYSGFVNNETENVLTGEIIIDDSCKNKKNVGSYTIIPSGLTSNNYNIIYQNGILHINSVNLTIKANDYIMTYTGLICSSNNYSITCTGFVNNETVNDLSGSILYSGNSSTAINASIIPYTIIPSGYSSDNYNIIYQNGTLIINKTLLTITADNKVMSYNGYSYDTSLCTVTYSGFMNNETETVLTGTLTYSGTFDNVESKNVGLYTIIPSGMSSNNYEIIYYQGILTINQIILTISANNIQMEYNGDYCPDNNFTVTYSGFINDETYNVLTGTLIFTGNCKTNINAGSYSIIPSGLTSINYNINYLDGLLTISKKDLSVTANNVTMIYNGYKYSGSNSVSYYGFIDGENESILSGNLLFNGTFMDNNSINVGTYTIIPSGLSSNNYNIIYNSGILYINTVNLVITADNKNINYIGITYPIENYTVSFTGFVNNENENVLTGSLIINGSCLTGINVSNSPYTIIPSGYSSNNYNIIYNNGTLNINKSLLTITADHINMNYTGLAYNGLFSANLSGFVNNETIDILTGELIYNVNYDINNTGINIYNTGSYTIIPSGLSSDNYNITYINGLLNIDKTELIVKANDITIIYDGLKHINDYTVTFIGFVNGEDITDNILGGSLIIGGTCLNAIEVNNIPYTIIPSGYSSNNYNITYETGYLYINKAELTIIANNKSMTYSGNNFEYNNYTITFIGFVNNENQTVLDGEISYGGSCLEGIYVNTYDIIPSGFTSNNYNITYQTGYLYINKAYLTVVADNKTISYTGLNYDINNCTVTYLGFVNGDDQNVLNGTIIYSGTFLDNDSYNVGTYTIIPSGLSSDNYNFIYNNGILTINKTILNIIANNLSIDYLGTTYNNTFTVSYSGFVNGETYNVLNGNLIFGNDCLNKKDVGTYSIIPSGYTSNNYNIIYHNGIFSINAVNLIIKANDINMIYNGNTYKGDYTVTGIGFVGDETINNLTGSLIIEGTCLNAINVINSPYTIIPSGFSSNNYNITYQNGLFNVTKKNLSVTADNKSITYNGLIYNGDDTITYTGFVNGEDQSVLSGTISITGDYMNNSDVGIYTMIPSGLSSDNYDITYNNGTLTINPVYLTIKADDKTITYTGMTYDINNISVTYTGFVNNEDDKVLSGNLNIAGTFIDAIDVSSNPYTISVSGLSSNNYIINYIDGTLTINKAPLSVIVNNKVINYSGNYGNYYLNDYSVTYSGFVNGEDENVLTGRLIFNGDCMNNKNVGSYNITVFGLNSNNYEITYNSGLLIINKAPLTVMADNITIVYNGKIYNGNYTLSYAGFVSNEQVTSLTKLTEITGNCLNAINVGDYTIIPSTYYSNNYDITYQNGSLTINKANLTIIASNKSMDYTGLVYPYNNFTVTYSGFVNGENNSILTGILIYGGDAVINTDVNTYEIIPFGYSSNNYNIEYVNGYLTINKVNLTITANNRIINYGSFNGINGYSVSYNGFVNGETQNVLSGSLTFNGNAIGAIYPSTISYTIIPSGLTSNNYNIIYVNGSLTINKGNLTVTADNKEMVYNGDIYNNGYTSIITGYISGETNILSVNDIIYTGGCLTAVNAGNYSIMPSGLSSDYYNITYVSGKLTISKTNLIISVNDVTIDYIGKYYTGGYTVNYNGFVANENEHVLTGSLIIGGTCTNAINVNTYTIIPSGYTSNNYNITYINGTLTINKVNLTITADNKTTSYLGVIYPKNNYTVTYTGLVNGETSNVLYGILNFTGSCITGKNVGSYIIIPSGFTSSNYNITYVNGTLTITKKNLYITANNRTISYIGIIYNGPYTSSYSGFVNGENTSVLTGTLTYSGECFQNVNVRPTPYTIIPSGYTSDNYNIIYTNGGLTIRKVVLTVLMGSTNKSLVYGTTIDYSQFYTITGFVNNENTSVISGAPRIYVNGSIGLNTYNAGIYSNITINNIGTLTATNYSFTINTSSKPKLIITKAPLYIIPNISNNEYTYGNTNFNYSDLCYLSGFVNGDTSSTIPITNTVHPTIVLNSSIYQYGITILQSNTYNILISDIGNLSSSNYYFVISNPVILPSFIVNKCPLNITVDTTYKPNYGDKNIQSSIFNNALLFSNLKYNDTKYNISTGIIKFIKSNNLLLAYNDIPAIYNITIDTSKFICANYTININITNYDITVDKGLLKVKPKNIITVLNYGESLDQIHLKQLYEITGFVDSDGTLDTVCSGMPTFYLKDLATNNIIQWSGQSIPSSVNGYGIYINDKGTIIVDPISNYLSNVYIDNSIIGQLDINKEPIGTIIFSWDKYVPKNVYGNPLSSYHLNATAPLNPVTGLPIGTISYIGQNINTLELDLINFTIGGTPNAGTYMLSAILHVTDPNYIDEYIPFTNEKYPILIEKTNPIIIQYDPLPIPKNGMITSLQLNTKTNIPRVSNDVIYNDLQGNSFGIGSVITEDMIVFVKLNNYNNANYLPKYTFKKIKLYTL